jgi:hypothetical protein
VRSFAFGGGMPVCRREIYSPEKRGRLSEFDANENLPVLWIAEKNNLNWQFLGSFWIDQPDWVAFRNLGLEHYEASVGIHCDSGCRLLEISPTHNHWNGDLNAPRASWGSRVNFRLTHDNLAYCSLGPGNNFEDISLFLRVGD